MSYEEEDTSLTLHEKLVRSSFAEFRIVAMMMVVKESGSDFSKSNSTCRGGVHSVKTVLSNNVCMYVCGCMCIYVYIYIYVCVCVCVYIYTYILYIRGGRSGHLDAVLVKRSESRVRSLVLKIFVPPVLVPPAIAFVSSPPRPPGAHVGAHSRQKVKLFVDYPRLEICVAHLYGKVAAGVVGWVVEWIDSWIHVRIDARAGFRV
jgi:hypothetical protein